MTAHDRVHVRLEAVGVCGVQRQNGVPRANGLVGIRTEVEAGNCSRVNCATRAGDMPRSAALKPAPNELPPCSSHLASPARRLNVMLGDRIVVQSAVQLRAVRIRGAFPVGSAAFDPPQTSARYSENGLWLYRKYVVFRSFTR